MGTGKTITTLTAIDELLCGMDINKVLVVAPLRVSLSTWSDEIESWDHISGLTYRVLAGLPPVKRLAAAMGDEDIHIINRENLVWLVEQFGDRWPYDMIVLDESRSFKNHRSKRFKALRKIRNYVSRIVELTGTPAPRGYEDLWAQLNILDRGERLGRTVTGFRTRYFDSDFMGYTYTLKDGAGETIREKISDICMSIEAKDHMDLPELIINPIKVTLPKVVREQYDELAREYVLAFEDEDDAIVASTAAVLRGKLHQVAQGFLYYEDGEHRHLHNEKLDALADIIEEANGMPVLVANIFRADAALIRERFKDARQLDKDPETIRQWNRGEIPILVAHPASCGHGLSLQHGGNILAWYGLTDDLELFQQMIERIGPTRQKQSGYDREVYCHMIMAENTVDELIYSSNIDKELTQAELMEALKRQIEGGK